MGSGLSLTSVNKIKELASAREYSLALDIIDSQDLSRSFNPQFLRLCGDIYTVNKRYDDARRTLVMAHKLAPEAKRVIYSFVDLYLRMGFRELADFYYMVYMSDADEDSYETRHIKYIYQKATGSELSDIEVLIYPLYRDNMDYDWTFELILLLKIQGRADELVNVAEDYLATYKNTKNANTVSDIMNANADVSDLFYVYAKENMPDDSPDMEQLREEERKLMEADESRVNPKEAVIQIVFDDSEVIFGSKRKYKRHLKIQEKLARKAEKEQTNEDSQESETECEQEDVQVVSDSEVSQEGSSDVEQEQSLDTQGDKKTFKALKRLFSKKKKEEKVDDEEEAHEDTKQQTDEEEAHEDTKQQADEEEAHKNTDELPDEDVASDDTHKEEADFALESDDNESSDETVNEISEEDFDKFEMREIYSNENKKISVVSDFGDVDFVAEFEDSNPFDAVSGEKEKREEMDSESVKTGFVFEDAELVPEYHDSEFEIDDFSVENQAEFEFLQVDETVDANSTSGVEEVVSDDITEKEVPEELIEEESEEEEMSQEELEELAEEESAEEEMPQEELEELVEEESDEEEMPQEELEELAEEESDEEEIPHEELQVTEEYDSSDRDKIFAGVKEKSKMDFPVFKTNLFPEYNQSVVKVENNFNEIMNEAQDKINENLIKEEQMQREAEALLASLGISLDDIPTSTNATSKADTKQVIDNAAKKEVKKTSGPSRDELKASLKIDSVKKDILKNLKEYR